MRPGDDFIVSRKDQYQIAQVARRVLADFPNCVRGRIVDPVGILKRLRKGRLSEKGKLRIVLTRSHDEASPARVSYNPLTLTVSRKIWWDARATNKDFLSWLAARWVLFHELGHIFLHDETAKRFSNDASLRTSLPNEQSAEDQADKFAMFLACPMRDGIASMSADDLVILHGLPEEICDEIIEIASTYVMHKEDANYTQIPCDECGANLKHLGTHLTCDNCVPAKIVRL